MGGENEASSDERQNRPDVDDDYTDEKDYRQSQKDAQDKYWRNIDRDEQGRSGEDSDAREGSNWSCNNNPSGRD